MRIGGERCAAARQFSQAGLKRLVAAKCVDPALEQLLRVCVIAHPDAQIDHLEIEVGILVIQLAGGFIVSQRVFEFLQTGIGVTAADIRFGAAVVQVDCVGIGVARVGVCLGIERTFALTQIGFIVVRICGQIGVDHKYEHQRQRGHDASGCNAGDQTGFARLLRGWGGSRLPGRSLLRRLLRLHLLRAAARAERGIVSERCAAVVTEFCHIAHFLNHSSAGATAGQGGCSHYTGCTADCQFPTGAAPFQDK